MAYVTFSMLHGVRHVSMLHGVWHSAALCPSAYALNDDSIVPKNRRAPEQITCAADCS
jgi:hypothetical protein